MEISALTDIGRVRVNNQDFYNIKIFSDDFAWAVVCDGMGGAAAGNIASKTAVEIIIEHIDKHLDCHHDDEQIMNTAIDAVKKANSTIYDDSTNDPELSGMGTTVVLSIVKNDKLHIISVGDSRAYLITQDNAYQITKDHSMVQEMLDSGKISKEEALNHPRKNIITRALGVSDEIQVDYYQAILRKNDIIFLCTDGFSNYASPETIYQITRSCDFENLATTAVNFANECGGQDNVTVIAMRRDNSDAR